MSVSQSALPVRAQNENNNGQVEPWLDATAADDQLLEQVAQWYRRCLAGHSLPQQALARRGLSHPELWNTFEIGFADRRLGRYLPGAKTVAGRELRARLQSLGVLRESGHGHYNGSITFPLRDTKGKLVDIYGRKIGRNLLRGTELHTYLPDTERTGIFYPAAFNDTDRMVLTDSPLNALSFWCAGVREVTCTLHGQEIGEDLLAMFEQSCVSCVLIAFRNTKSGVTHAENVAARLKSQGLQALTLTFPAGRDANDVLLQADAGRLVTLVREVGGRNGTAVPIRPVAASEEQTVLYAPLSNPPLIPEESQPQTKTTSTAKSEEQPPGDNVTPSADGEIKLVFDDRHYRVRGLEKNLSLERMKINLQLT